MLPGPRAGRLICVTQSLLRTGYHIVTLGRTSTSVYHRRFDPSLWACLPSLPDLKGECIRPGTPLTVEDARRLVDGYVTHYNTVRLHSAIGYVTPKDKLEGREADIFAQRDRKLAEARERRRAARRQARDKAVA